jgi:hypothetical protein
MPMTLTIIDATAIATANTDVTFARRAADYEKMKPMSASAPR